MRSYGRIEYSQMDYGIEFPVNPIDGSLFNRQGSIYFFSGSDWIPMVTNSELKLFAASNRMKIEQPITRPKIINCSKNLEECAASPDAESFLTPVLSTDGSRTGQVDGSRIMDSLAVYKSMLAPEGFVDGVFRDPATLPQSGDGGSTGGSGTPGTWTSNSWTVSNPGNLTFAMTHSPVTGTESVYFNGLKLSRTGAYTIAGTVLTLADSGSYSAGDFIEIIYAYSS